MNGVMGLSAWRWLFIFNFILGIPVAILGFATCPSIYTSSRPVRVPALTNYIQMSLEGKRFGG